VTYLIDTHCHLNFDAYTDDLDAVLERAYAANVRQVIIPGVDLESCEAALELAHRYEMIFVAVGLHPNSTADFTDKHLDQIRELTNDENVVAVGEIGLDYHWDKSPVDVQKVAFRAQLDVAADLELPVIIHNREASDDVLDILEDWAETLPDAVVDRPGVLHSFSAPQSAAERALAIGFYLGFTGPITFKNADSLRRIAATVPEDRILVETDGPFLTPAPYRGKRNEPAYIPHIVDRLASLKTQNGTTLADCTTENAIRLFNLPRLEA